MRKSGIFFIKPVTLTRCRLRYTVLTLVYFAQTWPFATDVLQGRRVQSLPSMRAESDSDSEGIGGSWRMRFDAIKSCHDFQLAVQVPIGCTHILSIHDIACFQCHFIEQIVWICLGLYYILSRCSQFVSCLIVPAFSRFTFTAIQRELANSTLAEFGTVDYKQTPQGREKKRFEAVCAQQISTDSVYLRLWGSLGVSSGKVPWAS